MNLYCKLPFGQLDSRTQEVIELARLLDRTPGSVAMKLVNLAALDPIHKARGVGGLSRGSRLDQEVWTEFEDDRESIAYESERLLALRRGVPIEESADIMEADLPRAGKEREQMVKVRVNQSFFRSTVLAAYDRRCCVTGIAVPELLVASHVVPWAANADSRVNPRNGLCLNAFHDRAFDRGLFTLTDDLVVEVSRRVLEMTHDDTVRRWLVDYHGRPIRSPSRYSPDVEFIRWHRQHCFSVA